MSKADPECAFVMSSHIHMVSGRMGVTDGFNALAEGITEDNDGEFTGYVGVIDLSKILSMKLGKQLSQMANYRVSFMQIDLRNINNALDNDAGLTAGGVIRWMEPTKHRVDALQYARKYVRQLGDTTGASTTNPFAFYNDDKHYKGLRFNWNADGQVDSETPDGTSILAGSYFALDEILYHYAIAMGGTPGDEGRPTSGEGEALWIDRTGSDQSLCDNGVYWVTSYTNTIPTSDLVDDGQWHDTKSDYWQLDLGNRHVSVLGGLLNLEVVHTNTDMAGFAEDEFYVQVTLGIEGWEEF